MIDILKECEGAKKIGISGHVRPDGDCVGSTLALQMYLRKCLPDAEITVYLEQPPEIFCEIVGFNAINSEFPDVEEMDVFFVLDCMPDRTGGAAKYETIAKKTINIDHHMSNPGSTPLSVVKPEAGSCCEVLMDLLKEEKLDKDIAMSLYIGIIHDTGVFQYSCTSPDTMMKGAKLIAYGFDYPRLIQETFYQKTYTQTQIMGRVLMESVRFMDGKCIVGLLDKKTQEFYNVTPKDFDGIVNQLRNIKGISCAIFMYQTDVLEYKASLRTDETINAAAISTYFGGGGHARAAGCTLQGTFYDCINNLSAQIEKQLEKA